MNATIIRTHASVGFEENRVPALTAMEDTRACARAAFVDSPVNLVSRAISNENGDVPDVKNGNRKLILQRVVCLCRNFY